MSRSIIAPAVIAGLIAFNPLALAQDNQPSPEGNTYLTPEVIQAGLKLLANKDLAIYPSLDFRPNFYGALSPRDSLNFLSPKVNINLLTINRTDSDLAKATKAHQLAVEEHQAVVEQLARETNDLLKHQLEVQRKQLEIQIEQTKIAAEQALALGQLRDTQLTAFEYQKQRDNALLRRLDYKFRPGKLVVVVADFSSGGSGEGVEVADEITNALHELREKCGIDTEILVGEIKPGVVIRSEQLALDVGQHFPKGTSYAVVWGTLSPRTVGKFRPHVTCAVKVDDSRGLGRSYTIDLESQPLPLGDTPEEQRRDQHRQLVAFACAVIPGVYASYEITQERRPKLDKFLAFLDSDDKTKSLASDYRNELEPLTRWVDGRPKYPHLRRMTPVSKKGVYPRLVLNTHDGAMMTLITEPGSDRAMRFRDQEGEYIVYIDVTETSNRQFVKFLNDAGNRKDGGSIWLKITGANSPIRITEDKRFEVVSPDENAERPVSNLSYFGAKSYCRWAGKELPTVTEWRAAATPTNGGKYPWGDACDALATLCGNKLSCNENPARIGSFPTDRSRIGCLDMAGNVSEWCAEFQTGSESARWFCGGNCCDIDAAHFTILRESAAEQVTHHPWLGFRGVVRIRVSDQ